MKITVQKYIKSADKNYLSIKIINNTLITQHSNKATL